MQRRVLLVDDESAVLFAYRKYLKRIGCEVDTADSKKVARRLLESIKYEYAILDIRLSDMFGEEGIELMKYARCLQPGIKLIMITAYGSQEVRDKALDNGADAYLEKPVSIHHIQKILENGDHVSSGEQGERPSGGD